MELERTVEIQKEYNRWLNNATGYCDELETMTSDQKEDAFYKELEFGTGGLRGILGAGTNRMNVYSVAKASQGLANFLLKKGGNSIAIAYDSRNYSDVFSKVAASVFAENGLKTFIFKELMPTPCLSFAIRYLKCDSGIVITASHNPAQYNGYKVYNNEGCQITKKDANDILQEIKKCDYFDNANLFSFDQFVKSGEIEFIGDDCFRNYIEEVKAQSILFGERINKNIDIVYSPLNGTGLKPVITCLRESGFNKITVVEEQRNPNGNFPTCHKPNPEEKEALLLGIEYAEKISADIVMATDPDCDRVGIAVKEKKDYILLSGNQVGLLLLDFIGRQRRKNNELPQNPIMIKTIVTTGLAERIAENYGLEVKNVLTGFKYIGEQIGKLEKNNEEGRFVFGFEESYGYLSGSYVRDKDAVNAALLICEMLAYYKERGSSLYEQLLKLYSEYGYCVDKQFSYEFPGITGKRKITNICDEFRLLKGVFARKKIIEKIDYNKGNSGLPRENVIKLVLEDGSSLVVRPSGTEPKLKIYFSTIGENLCEAEEKCRKYKSEIENIIMKKS